MKARKVHESISFKRGEDPHNALDIGYKKKIDDWINMFQANPPQYEITDKSEVIVYGRLVLPNDNIDWVPANLEVHGTLDLTGTKVSELPLGLNVDNLYINDTGIKKLPDDIVIHRSLEANNSELEELPDGLTLNGALDVRGSELSEFPDGLNVNGYVDIRDTYIKSISKPIKVGGLFYSDIPSYMYNMHRSNITPTNESFKRGESGYKSLGVGAYEKAKAILDEVKENDSYFEYELENEGDLHLIIYNDINTYNDFLRIFRLSKLVDRVTIEAWIDLRNSLFPFDQLPELRFPENLRVVDGPIRLFGVKTVIVLPDNLTVHGRLDVSETYIRELPKNLKVNGSLNIAYTHIDELPEGLSVDQLYWEGSKLESKYPGKTKYFKKKYKQMFWDQGIKIFMDILD